MKNYQTYKVMKTSYRILKTFSTLAKAFHVKIKTVKFKKLRQ